MLFRQHIGIPGDDPTAGEISVGLPVGLKAGSLRLYIQRGIVSISLRQGAS